MPIYLQSIRQDNQDTIRDEDLLLSSSHKYCYFAFGLVLHLHIILSELDILSMHFLESTQFLLERCYPEKLSSCRECPVDETRLKPRLEVLLINHYWMTKHKVSLICSSSKQLPSSCAPTAVHSQFCNRVVACMGSLRGCLCHTSV